jgi:hypothetical protein
MPLRQLLAAVAISTALASCASAPPVSSAPQSNGDRSALVFPSAKRWVGSLKPTQSYSSAISGSQRQIAYGNAELTVDPSNPTLTHIRLKVSVPADAASGFVGWGLSSGRCGSGNPTVLTPSSFPSIQLNSTGQGTVDAQIPFVISDNGSYHVDIFRGTGSQLVDMITCADLRRDG